MVRTIEAAVRKINDARRTLREGATVQSFPHGPFAKLGAVRKRAARHIFLELRGHKFASALGYNTDHPGIGDSLALLFHKPPLHQIKLTGKWKEKLRRAGYKVENAQRKSTGGFRIIKKRDVGAIILNENNQSVEELVASHKHFLSIVRILFSSPKNRKTKPRK